MGSSAKLLTALLWEAFRYQGLADGGVDYALDEHNRSELSDEIIATVESLKAKIIAGEIVVPNEVSLPR